MRNINITLILSIILILASHQLVSLCQTFLSLQAGYLLKVDTSLITVFLIAGPYIEYIQEALNLVSDGRFGETTHQAVLAFQAQKGLSQDGKVGRNTWNALREKRDGGSSSGGSSSGYDDGSTYTGAFKLPSGHCYGKLGIAYASHN